MPKRSYTKLERRLDLRTGPGVEVAGLEDEHPETTESVVVEVYSNVRTIRSIQSIQTDVVED